jgi:peptidyl-prolyl cis-trans isomerase SurA
MNRALAVPALSLLLAPTLALALTPALAQNAPPSTPAENATPPTPSPPAVAPDAVQLDHVVAVIGSNVILQSDVEQEMRLAALEPLQVLPGQNTPDRALRRLIDRTLILQQMREQDQPLTTPAPEVESALQELDKQIPECRQKFRCQTEQGWHEFLQAHQLDETEVRERWSQRMAMLRFIDLRFRSGIHVSPQEISAYYQKTLVPALEKDHQKAPPLRDVSSRIQEILLQQQVSGLFRDWLESLRDQGNVQIVDSAYSADLNSSTSGEDQSS